MANRSAKLLLASIIIAITAVLLMGAGPAKASKTGAQSLDRYTGAPTGIRPSPSVATPGAAITVTVSLNQITSTDQEVAVGTSDTSMFVSFPSTVTVPAGSNSTSFVVYVRPDAQKGYLTLSAACNGMAVYYAMDIAIPPAELP